jgi:HEAT repeat protein
MRPVEKPSLYDRFGGAWSSDFLEDTAIKDSSEKPVHQALRAGRVRVVLIAFFLLGQVPLLAQARAEKAWTILEAGLAEKNAEHRVAAVRALGLLEKDSKAADLALKALSDESPDVRTAAADALGQMKAKQAAPRLADVVDKEQELSVVLASARSLVALGAPLGYNVYYEVLTGERKSGGALLEDQKKKFRDPKKIAEFGFEHFVPFAGAGYGAFKALRKDEASLVRAAAAKTLAKDPDAKSGRALVQATHDKSWIVRAAALEALSHRGDPSVLGKIEPALEDDKDAVHYKAAAAIIHLESVAASRTAKRK